MSGLFDPDFAVSPDERFVVYSALHEGESRLLRASTSGGTPEAVTLFPAFTPAYSPDGKRLAYYFLDRASQSYRIGIAPAQGGPPELVLEAEPPAAGSVILLRDEGLYLNTMPGDRANVWLQPLDGKPPRRVTDFQEYLVYGFDVSPDGEVPRLQPRATHPRRAPHQGLPVGRDLPVGAFGRIVRALTRTTSARRTGSTGASPGPKSPHEGHGRRGEQMKSAVWTGALAVSLLSMPVRPVAAQDPPFERIQLTRIVVKPGMTREWEAQLKLLNEARAKGKDPVARSLWQVGRGGPPRTYFSVIRFNKWAELESLTMNSDVLAKAFGEREAVRIGDAMGDTIESAQSEVMTVWKGMNSWKDGTWAYAWLTESQVRPAGLPQWEQQVTARVAATKKSPASPPAVRYRTTLGPSARFITARYFDKWSDVDGWPTLKDVVGQVEADKMDALARGALESGTNYVIRRRAELSYIPTP